MFWRRERATLDDVVELLRGIGSILIEIDEKLARLLGADGEDARVETRMQEREARRERSLLRRLFTR